MNADRGSDPSFVDLVVSVIELGDRPDDEQRHVRQQVRDE